MLNPLVIAPKQCQNLTWHPTEDTGFASQRPLIPLHAGELAKAAASMPLALVEQSGEWQLVAVCGVEPSKNLFVQDRQWLGSYRPQWLTTWPFEMISIKDRGLVVFDRDSGLLAEHGGEPFFDEDGRPSPRVAQVIGVLKTNHGRYEATKRAASKLRQAKVLIPWPESLRAQAGMVIPGLHMIDEKALAALDAESFLALRDAQALSIAYALNFSLQQVRALEKLGRTRPSSQGTVPDDLSEFFDKDGMINLKFDS